MDTMNRCTHLAFLEATRSGVRLRIDRADGSTEEREVAASDLTTEERVAHALGGIDDQVWWLVQELIIPNIPTRLFNGLPADILDRLEFKEPVMVVADVLPEGLAVLAGRPKIGKSWYALGLAIAVARTGRPVLYLALEDGNARIQRRVRMVVEGDRDAIPSGLEFHADWPNLDNGGLDRIAGWLDAHPRAALVVIDTIAKVRPHRKAGEDQYLGDVAVWSPLQQLASEHPGLAILAVHHQRKGAADDILDTVLGSQGVVGTVDTVLVLQKARGQADAELFIVGRDILDSERALQFSNGRWKDIGSADDYRMSKERAALVDLLAKAEPLSLKEIAVDLGKTYDATKKLVQRAEWEFIVQKLSDGKVIRR